MKTFEAELENKSSKLGAFEIAKIGPGGTFATVKAYVETERQRLGRRPSVSSARLRT